MSTKLNKAISAYLRANGAEKDARADDAWRHTATMEERASFKYSPKKGHKQRTAWNAARERGTKKLSKMLGVK